MARRSPSRFTNPLANEESIIRIAALYASVMAGILAIYSDFTNHLDRSRAEREMNDLLSDAEQSTRQWIEEEVPDLYKAGTAFAVAGMLSKGLGVRIGRGQFTGLDEQAVRNLAESIHLDFLEGIKGVRRNGIYMFSQADRILARRAIAGANELRKAKRGIVGMFDARGVIALRDRGGKTWQLDKYAEMLARTKQTEVHNTAVSNRALENGYDLVQISSHGGGCPLCQPWDGKVVSLSGQTKGYPTLDQAESDGLFHPNCKHVYSVITPEEAEEVS